MVSFWIRIITGMTLLFMFVGTGLIPVHLVLRDHPRCSHGFEWIRNVVPKEAFNSAHEVFPREKKEEFKG